MKEFIEGWLWLLSIAATVGGVFAALALINSHYFKNDTNEKKIMKGHWRNQPYDLDD